MKLCIPGGVVGCINILLIVKLFNNLSTNCMMHINHENDGCLGCLARCTIFKCGIHIKGVRGWWGSVSLYSKFSHPRLWFTSLLRFVGPLRTILLSSVIELLQGRLVSDKTNGK